MKIKDHMLTNARFIHSPNQDDRSATDLILIVIHGISLPPGDFDSDDIILLFTNQLDCSREAYSDLLDVKVSSHILIRRDGEIILKPKHTDLLKPTHLSAGTSTRC